jgi:type 2 lantibiotic biosynthesis protein LanM
VALLERPGYGWSEFVTARPCVNHGQVEAFYRKQGAWLALLHFLHGTDLHYENLIAHAEDPVLVDIETLFHPYAPDEEDEDPAVLALRSSVFGVGLLPHLLVGDETVLDVSGLGGDKAVALPTPGVEWADAGTDTMRLVRRARQFTGAENRPRIHGADADADPAVHTEALLAGFRVGYRTVVAGRGELLGQDGLLRRFADDEIRVVARATAGYATLLDESTHPDALRDAEERESVLRQLDTDAFGHPGWPGLADEEIAELWDGDVPMFTTRPGSTDLWSGTGRRIPGALERPGLLRVEERLRAMGQADLAAQEWIVRAAMASRSTSPAHRVGDPLPDAPGHAAEGSAAETPGQDRARLLAAARGIGDRLVESAHQGPQKANWLGLELLADRYWRLAPCGADLGGGFPGPALFLAQLFALTGTARYAETARRALRPLPRLLDRLARHPENLAEVGSGAFAGLGGIAYALAQVAELLDDSDIRDLVEPATALTVHAVEAEEAPGVADGTAGGVAALLAVHRLTGSATAWHGARTGATRLVDSPPPAAPGFAAGAAGVGWALLTYAAAGGGTACERAGLEVLRAAARSATGRSWCEGLPGVALAVADSAAATADPELARFAANAVEAVAAVGALPDHSLCHGELGALEALSAPVSAVGSARGAVRFTGLAGIGHGILRLGFPERTPSVLLLQPPTGGGPSHRAPQPHRMESHRGRR